MTNRFGVIVTVIKKKPYNFLDQRKTDFDLDYDEFKRQIQEMHVCSEMDNLLSRVIKSMLRNTVFYRDFL